MRSKPILIVGAIFVILGVAALLHPVIRMPAKRTQVQIGSTKEIIETRRIFDVPPILSGAIVFCGGLLLFLSRGKT